MKRFISWTLVILFTFALGVSTTFLWINNSFDITGQSKANLFEDLPILNYCELRNNPDKYDGMIIRLRADISSGNHGEYLYDTRCPGDENIKDYNDATAAVLYIDWKEQRRVTNVRSERTLRPWTDPVNVIAVGKFRKNEPTKDSELANNSVFHFVVISLEFAIDIY